MQGNRNTAFQRKGKRSLVARAGARALRLILAGISARTHAIAGTRPSLPTPSDVAAGQ